MTPKVIPNLDSKIIARFWKRVEIKGPNECWPFKDIVREDGYGRLRVKGKKHYAHRVAFVASGKQFTNGPHVRHVVCANRRCCNPAHLESGTKQDNADDREKDGRTSRGNRHSAIMTETIRRRSKLSLESATEIRELCASGIGHRELSEKFEVAISTISSVVTGRNWKV
jgi:hypothetical protein